MDWLFLRQNRREKSEVPIINLVQGVRHADASQELRAFLHYRAVRICVSHEVADAIRNTGAVNGPVFTIPECIDLSSIQNIAGKEKKIDILVNAVKHHELGMEIGKLLVGEGIRALVHMQQIPRPAFLELVAQAKIVVCLPLESEGFYLPALEAMAAGCIVICPDCIGNRSFCHAGVNCFMPAFNAVEIVHVVRKIQAMPETDILLMQNHALQTAAQRNLIDERMKFLEILENVDEIWRSP